MQHKKRGRPKLREKKVYSSNEHNYEILYGTIQTPAITMKNPTRNIIPNNQVPPFKTKLATITKRPSVISFIHEPIESFQSSSSSISTSSSSNHHINSNSNYQQNVSNSISATAASIPLTFDYNNVDTSSVTIATTTATNNANVLLESVLPTIQLSANPLLTIQQQQSLPPPPPQQQQIYFGYDQINNSNATTPVLLNTHTSIITPKAETASNQQQQHDVDHHQLSIIMSMEVCCAKVSDETIKFWGYYPQELAHRSFYDFISPKDSDRLARLHRLLLDNSMDIAKSKMGGENTPLPPTERTTSSLFSNIEHGKLNVIANGSRSFSDTIHVKKRSGEYELYKVVVYIGGGLGADLYDISSFSKQYIVAQFRKHEYEVAPKTPSSALVMPLVTAASTNAPANTTSSTSTALLDNHTSLKSSLNSNSNNDSYYNNNNIQPIAVFSPMSPLSPTSPSTNSLLNFSSSSSSSIGNSSIHNNNTPATSNATAATESYKDNYSIHSSSSIFRSPISYNNDNIKKTSTTTKFSQMSIIPPSSPPKFNIAPITTAAASSFLSKNFGSSNSLFRRFPASVSTAAAGGPTTTASSSVIASPTPARLGSTDNAMVTHPTQQYFLQTSSSTLNAAAAASQSKTRLSISGPTNNDNSSTTNRKIEMSIRSLLC